MIKMICPDCGKELHLNIETRSFMHWYCFNCKVRKLFDKIKNRFLSNVEIDEKIFNLQNGGSAV